MAKGKSGSPKTAAAGSRKRAGAASGKRTGGESAPVRPPVRGKVSLMTRVPTARAGRSRGGRAEESAPAGAASGVPEATVSRTGGTVSVEITFGQAQHGKFTIQLFDPAGTTELAREAGLNTDSIPDRFDLRPTPSQLDQHLVQWSGAVSAFSPAPGQQFSVIFDVTQNGSNVPDGHVEQAGPLNITQAFLGILRLVTR